MPSSMRLGPVSRICSTSASESATRRGLRWEEAKTRSPRARRRRLGDPVATGSAKGSANLPREGKKRKLSAEVLREKVGSPPQASPFPPVEVLASCRSRKCRTRIWEVSRLFFRTFASSLSIHSPTRNLHAPGCRATAGNTVAWPSRMWKDAPSQRNRGPGAATLLQNFGPRSRLGDVGRVRAAHQGPLPRGRSGGS